MKSLSWFFLWSSKQSLELRLENKSGIEFFCYRYKNLELLVQFCVFISYLDVPLL